MINQNDHSDRLTNAEAVKALASIVLSDCVLETVLQRAAEMVKRSLSGADEVSITMQNGAPLTVATTGELATEVDESQYQAGYGPCLDAIRLGQTVVVADQIHESRWPNYSPHAVRAGVRSSLSVPLPVDGQHVGAFNVYSQTAASFDLDAVASAEELAEYAAIVLNNAGVYFSASARADQMVEAMQSRAVIEQAKGILMGARRCDADEAFGVLVDVSQQSHRKLRDVAQALVEQAAQGQLTVTGTSSARSGTG